MHALLIILGNDIKIREVVENDKERMVEMLTRISYHCNVLTTIMESKGASEGAISKGFLSEGSASKPETTIQGIIRSEQVIEWLENLNPNPEDIVLVYYAGHGEIGPSALLFDSGSNGNDTLDRKRSAKNLRRNPPGCGCSSQMAIVLWRGKLQIPLTLRTFRPRILNLK